MWKRLNNPRGVRQPVEESRKMYDGEGNNLGLMGHPRQEGAYGDQRRAPERPRREEDMAPKGLPRLPFEAVPPNPNQDSTFRPASSIYSQPSPNPIHTRFHQTSYQTPYPEELEDVSPESSPELRPVNNRSQSQESEGVSPIDEMPDVSHLTLSRPESSSNNPSSSIPVLRREKRNQVAAAAANLVGRKKPGDNPRGRTAHDPRWDPYSGEITTSDRGKPQSVKPGTFSVPGLRAVHKETGLPLGNESSITTNSGAKQHTSFSDRVRRLKSTTGNAPVERPGWKGATGRVTLVSPVHDQLDMPPLSIPRKSSKRIASPDSETFSNGGGVSPVTIVRNRSGETSPASANYPSPSIHAVLDSNTDNPDTRSNSPNDNPRSPISVREDPVVVSQSAAAGTLARNANNSTSPSSPQNPGGWDRDEGTMADIERSFQEQLKTVSSPITEEPEPGYIQPSSRFSVTTYAPSTAHNTPRPSTDTFNSHPCHSTRIQLNHLPTLPSSSTGNGLVSPNPPNPIPPSLAKPCPQCPPQYSFPCPRSLRTCHQTTNAPPTSPKTYPSPPQKPPPKTSSPPSKPSLRI